MNSKNKTCNWKLVNFCEFDKYAVKSYCAIHDVDESLNLGDITKVDENKLEPFFMIVGGSPCTDFSVAGKQKGSVWECKQCDHEYNPLTVHWSQRDKCPKCGNNDLKKTHSSLLVEWLRIIRANKPNFGIYENVKNIVGKQFKETTFKIFEQELQEYGYNTYWKVLNAKDYGVPQNRERVYLILIKKELDNGQFKFPDPFDNGIRLKDILESDVDEKYYISDDKVERFLNNLNSKESQINKNAVKQLGNISECNKENGWSNPQIGRVYDINGCSPTLNTCGGGSHEPKVLCQYGIDKSFNDTKVIENSNCITAREDRGISNRKSEGTAVLEEIKTPDVSYCIDANYHKGTTIENYYNKHRRQLVTEEVKILQTPRGFNKGGLHDECPTISSHSWEQNNFVTESADGIYTNVSEEFQCGALKDTSRCLKANKHDSGVAIDNIRIRKLIPKECFRLMGFSNEDFFKAMIANTKEAEELLKKYPNHYGKRIMSEAERIQRISNSQLYKMSGNSIVVDVLYYILVELYKVMPYLFDDLRLSSYFSGIGAFECALNRLYEDINAGNFTRPQVECAIHLLVGNINQYSSGDLERLILENNIGRETECMMQMQ